MASTPSNPWFAVSMGLIGLIVGYSFATVSQGFPTILPTDQPTVTDEPTDTNDTPATADDDPVLGKANAPITLIEFSDLQCPYCRKFIRETLPSIKKDYIDTGKVKLVYRDFPLSFHPAAMPSALAMECADDQSDQLAWAVHDAIYNEQEKSGVNTVQYTAEDIKKWVAGISGLNQQTFATCLDSKKHEAEVKKDMADGSASGIDGTPGFWILGPDGQKQKISGAYPYATFQQAFDAML